MALSRNSMYLATEIIEPRSSATGKLVKRPFVDLRQRVSEESSDDSIVLYDTVDHWAGLGLTYLDDANAWWAIADLSGIIDPFGELVEAAQLRVPSALRYQLEIVPSARGDF